MIRVNKNESSSVRVAINGSMPTVDSVYLVYKKLNTEESDELACHIISRNCFTNTIVIEIDWTNPFFDRVIEDGGIVEGYECLYLTLTELGDIVSIGGEYYIELYTRTAGEYSNDYSDDYGNEDIKLTQLIYTGLMQVDGDEFTESNNGIIIGN